MELFPTLGEITNIKFEFVVCFAVCSMQLPVCSVHCSLCSVQFSVQYEVCSEEYTVFSLQCAGLRSSAILLDCIQTGTGG